MGGEPREGVSEGRGWFLWALSRKYLYLPGGLRTVYCHSLFKNKGGHRGIGEHRPRRGKFRILILRVHMFYLPSILGDLDTWVSDAIQYIRYQVSNNHRDSKQNDCSLHDGVVAGVDGGDRDLRDAADVENPFDNKCACDKQADRKAKNGHQRNHRVSKAMPIDHRAFAHDLCSCRAYIILA